MHEHSILDRSRSTAETTKRVEELVTYCSTHAGELVTLLPMLLNYDRPSPFKFSLGEKLSVALHNPRDLIEPLLAAIRSRVESSEPTDSRLLGGLLSGLREINPEQVETILESLVGDSVLASQLAFLTAVSKPLLSSVKRCTDAVITGSLTLGENDIHALGNVSANLDPPGVAALADGLRSQGSPSALQLALALLCVNVSEQVRVGKIVTAAALRRLLMDRRLVCSLGDSQSFAWYWFDRSASLLLSVHRDCGLARSLARRLLAAESIAPRELKRQVAETIRKLLDEYWQTIWPTIRAIVEQRGMSAATRARALFGGEGAGRGDIETGISQIGVDDAQAWCTQQLDAASLLLQMLPLATTCTGSTEFCWNPVAQSIVESHIGDQGVMVTLDERLWILSGTGSLSEAYRKMARFAGTLEKNANPAVRQWARKIQVELESAAVHYEKR